MIRKLIIPLILAQCAISSLAITLTPCKVENVLTQPHYGTSLTSKAIVQIIQIFPVFTQNIMVGKCINKDLEMSGRPGDYFVCRQRYSAVEVYITDNQHFHQLINGTTTNPSSVNENTLAKQFRSTNFIKDSVVVESGCEFTFNLLPLLLRQQNVEPKPQDNNNYRFLKSPYHPTHPTFLNSIITPPRSLNSSQSFNLNSQGGNQELGRGEPPHGIYGTFPVPNEHSHKPQQPFHTQPSVIATKTEPNPSPNDHHQRIYGESLILQAENSRPGAEQLHQSLQGISSSNSNFYRGPENPITVPTNSNHGYHQLENLPPALSLHSRAENEDEKYPQSYTDSIPERTTSGIISFNYPVINNNDSTDISTTSEPRSEGKTDSDPPGSGIGNVQKDVGREHEEELYSVSHKVGMPLLILSKQYDPLLKNIDALQGLEYQYSHA